MQLIQLETPQRKHVPLTGMKLVAQFSQKLSAEQLMQLELVVSQMTHALPLLEGTTPWSGLQALQTLGELHSMQLGMLQAKHVKSVVLRVNPSAH